MITSTFRVLRENRPFVSKLMYIKKKGSILLYQTFAFYMDITTLLETSLPVLIHDSVVLKQISNESIEKIFEIYSQSEKQIFVSIDKDTSYTEKTAALISSYEVLRLSPCGNELYGFPFGK